MHKVGACVDRHVQGPRVPQPAAVRGAAGAYQPCQPGQRQEPHRRGEGHLVLPVPSGATARATSLPTASRICLRVIMVIDGLLPDFV